MIYNTLLISLTLTNLFLCVWPKLRTCYPDLHSHGNIRVIFSHKNEQNPQKKRLEHFYNDYI